MQESSQYQEEQRLRALADYRILDSEPEPGFDELTELAAELCEVPAALVSLVDRDRQWFKSRLGVDHPETPLSNSFCARVVHTRTELLEIPDLLEDREFRHYDAVTKDGLRFYAGALIESSDGYPLGTLCLVDHKPRQLNDQQRRILRVLSNQVQSQLELRRAHHQVRDHAHHLQTLVDQLPVMVCELDADCCFTFSNRLYREWWGFKDDHINGRHLSEVITDSTLCIEKQSLISRCLQEGVIEREEVSPEGRVREIVYMPLRPGDPHSTVLIVGRDVTEERRVEAMKNEFVSTVSHELRTPLTSIIGALGLVTGGALGNLSEQAQSMLDIALDNSQRLRHLINDLLDMDKLVAGQMVFDMQPQPLAPLVEKAVAEIESYAEPYGVEVSAELPGETLEATVDGFRFQQILANLLSNAVKFSPEGARVRIQLFGQHGHARVAVVDEGPGISIEAQKRLFERFYQVDGSNTKNKGGTGLGLAISKQLAERMNGHLFVQSEEGKGATFVLDLPRSSEVQPGTASEALPENRPLVVSAGDPGEGHELLAMLAESDTPPRKLRVLHVEDDRDLQRVLSAVGEDLARFDCVQTIAEARRILAEAHYDLVILDVDLPDGYGWSLLEDLRSVSPSPSVVVLSGLDDPPPKGVHIDEHLAKGRVSDEDFRDMLVRFVHAGLEGVSREEDSDEP